MDRMLDALSEYKLAESELGRIEEDIASAKKEKDDQVAQMAVIVSVQQQWQELNNRIEERENELKVWQDRRNQVRINLAGEVAKKRTHMETVQAAQELFLPHWPTLSMILAGGLCLALLAIHWAISPLVTMGKKAVAFIWVVQIAAWLLLMAFNALAAFLLLAAVAIPAIIAVKLDRLWMQSKAGAAWCVVFSIGMVLASGMLLYGVTLRLQYPDLYPAWKANPLAFLYRQVADGIHRVGWLFDQWD